LQLGLALAPLPLQSVTVSLGTSFSPPFSFLLMALVFSIIPGATMLAAGIAARRGAKANIIKAIAVGPKRQSAKRSGVRDWPNDWVRRWRWCWGSTTPSSARCAPC
jgi:hypothetical protein